MKFGTKEALAFGLPFLVGVGACYSFGYWSVFGLNVLEFISLVDVAKLAVYPLLAVLALQVIFSLWNEILLGPIFPPGGGAKTSVGNFLQTYWRQLIAAELMAAVVVVLYVPEGYKWYLASALLVTAGGRLTHVNWLISLIPNPRLRWALVVQLLFLPMLSFSYGRAHGNEVLNGRSSLVVDAKRSNLQIADDPAAPVIYVGYIGQTYVLLEKKTGLLVMVKQKDDDPIFLRRK
jgi:hypothetical protein